MGFSAEFNSIFESQEGIQLSLIDPDFTQVFFSSNQLN